MVGSKKTTHVIWDIVIASMVNAAVKRTATGIRRSMFRHRHFWHPIWFATTIWVVAALGHALWAEYWWVMPVPWLVVLTAAVLGPRSSRWLQVAALGLVPETWDQGIPGVLDDKRERSWLGVLAVVVGGYWSWRTGWGPSAGTQYLWTVGLLVLGGTYWWARRIRSRGKLGRYTRRWVKLAEPKSGFDALQKSKVTKAQKINGAYQLRVALRPSVTVEKVTAGDTAESLASYFSLRKGACRITGDASSARLAIFTFTPEDPLGGTIHKPVPVPGTRSIADVGFRVPIGRTVHGDEDTIRIWHTFVCGSTGSGKSALVEGMMMEWASFTDVAIMAADFGGGTTYDLWQPVLSNTLPESIEEGVEFFAGISRIVASRERHLKALKRNGYNGDTLPVTREYPVIMVPVDEFPDYIRLTTKTELQVLIGIAQKGRKVNVWLMPNTQNGTKADIGSKELQGQLRCTISLGLDQQQSRNLWGLLTRTGWDSTTLGVGQYLVRDLEHTKPEPGKGYWTEPKVRREYAQQAAKTVAKVSGEDWAAFTGQQPVTVEEPEPVPAETRTELTIPMPRVTDDPLLAELAKAGKSTVDALAKAAGVPRTTAFRHMSAHTDAGRVRKVAGQRGVYELVQ